MNFSERFIKRPVMSTIVMLGIILMGLIAFHRLPVTDLPNVDFPVINVQASYAGASPEVMERMVVAPLEKELININGVEHITSQSSRGFCWMTMIFELDCDIERAAQDVQAALKRAEYSLPRDMEHSPVFNKANPHDESIIYLVLTSDSSSLAEMYEYAHTRIEQRIARIQGVGKVEVWGSPYALRIKINPEMMAARGLGFDEVRAAIAQATGKFPVGILETPGRKFTLEVPGKFASAAEFCHLSLAPDVHLQDIAEVTDGLESDELFHFITKEQDSLSVILGLKKQSGANAVKISKDLQRLVPQLQAELPSSMQLKLWFDKADWIKEAIEDVEWSLVLSFALVVVVIFFSLKRLRETLIAAATLPISVIGTFIIMHALNFNIDILSLLALTLAMGFVIDDAIVVLENIFRHIEKGLSPMQAALQGSKEIGFTILSMTLSLVAVFIPMLFMHDITGKLFREFSVTLAVSILVSGFVSLTLTPMLCSRFASTHKPVKNQTTNFLFRFYARSLNWCLKYRKTTLSCAFACVALAVMLFRFLPINLFPEEDRGFIWSFMQMPSGLSKADAEKFQGKCNNLIQAHPAVETFVALNFKDYYIYLIRLSDGVQRIPQVAVVADLQSKLNGIPGVQAFLRGMQLISAPMGGFSLNKYQFVMRGTDLREVNASAETLKRKLLENPAFVNPSLSIKADDPKLEVILDEEVAEKLSVSRQMVQALLQNAYAGASVGTVEKGSERYHVYLELDPAFQKNTAALAKLYLKTPTGDHVPLKSLATWKETIGMQSIDHIDLLPAITLSFDIATDVPLAESFTTLKAIAAETLPASVTGKLEGMAEKVDATSHDTLLLLILAVVAMYAILAILYESFVHPLTILSSLPFACLGGILTLIIFREPLSLYSMVGFLLLIGIVKKNGIMVVDYAIQIRSQSHVPALEAVKEACLIRFRPIMMTTFAAVMGALPIAIGIGAGAETRRGLGLVIAGGLIFSQFLTLYITPIVYFYFEKMRRKDEKEKSLKRCSYM